MSRMQKLSAVYDTATAMVHSLDNSRDKGCTNCGRRHPPRQFPAYGTTHGACGKQNHWASHCRIKNRNKRNTRSKLKAEVWHVQEIDEHKSVA